MSLWWDKHGFVYHLLALFMGCGMVVWQVQQKTWIRPDVAQVKCDGTQETAVGEGKVFSNLHIRQPRKNVSKNGHKDDRLDSHLTRGPLPKSSPLDFFTQKNVQHKKLVVDNGYSAVVGGVPRFFRYKISRYSSNPFPTQDLISTYLYQMYLLIRGITNKIGRFITSFFIGLLPASFELFFAFSLVYSNQMVL